MLNETPRLKVGHTFTASSARTRHVAALLFALTCSMTSLEGWGHQASAQMPVQSVRTGAAQPTSSSPSAQQPATISLSQAYADLLESVSAGGGSGGGGGGKKLASDKEFKAATQRAQDLFEHMLATTEIPPPSVGIKAAQKAVERYIQGASNARLFSHLEKCPPALRAQVIELYHARPRAVFELAMSIKPEDSIPAAYELLVKLAYAHPGVIDRLASLAAAVCVVHDAPLVRTFNENRATAVQPVDIFEYFVKNEKRLGFPVGKLPTQLLIYVVDTTATIQEMTWALERYQRDLNIGKRYEEIKYDHDHFTNGTPKKSTVAPGGWGLKAIEKYGGVCADQGYFATSVGKALGVPTVYITGRSAEIGHAWMGFFKASSSRASWDFSSGRYDEYEDVRGNIVDPQTRVSISDGHIGITAGYYNVDPLLLQYATAVVDASKLLGAIEKRSGGPGPTLRTLKDIETYTQGEPRDGWQLPVANVSSRLSLLESVLRKAPSFIPAWEEIKQMATSDELTYEDKVRWADVLFTLCGKENADFSLEIIRPMIATIKETKDQSALWDAAYKSYAHRPDLASQVRLAQGDLWTRAGEKAKAWKAYQEIISRFLNEGPFAVDAVARCERLLRDEGKLDEVLKLYQDTFKRAKRPSRAAPEFLRASNWFRLGLAYAQSLAMAGKEPEARKVLAEIGVDPAALRRGR